VCCPGIGEGLRAPGRARGAWRPGAPRSRGQLDGSSRDGTTANSSPALSARVERRLERPDRHPPCHTPSRTGHTREPTRRAGSLRAHSTTPLRHQHSTASSTASRHRRNRGVEQLAFSRFVALDERRAIPKAARIPPPPKSPSTFTGNCGPSAHPNVCSAHPQLGGV
jgi:hypothetical protein